MRRAVPVPVLLALSTSHQLPLRLHCRPSPARPPAPAPPRKHHTKSISIGWIVFSILIFEIYFSNLTAILSQPPDVISSIAGMKVCQRA